MTPRTRIPIVVTAAVALAMALLAGLLLGAAPSASADSQGLTIRIVNSSGVPDSQVYVLVTADGPFTSSVPANGTSVRLTDAAAGMVMASPAVGGTGGSYDFTVGAGGSGFAAGSLWVSYYAPLSNTARPSPVTSQVRFDQVELTYTASSRPATWADLTAVAMWGIPTNLDFFSRTTLLDQYSRSNGSLADLEAALEPVAPHAFVHGSDGKFLRVLSPVVSPRSYPDMSAYVTSLAGQRLTVSGQYAKAGDPNTGRYSYSGVLDPSGNVILTGTVRDPAAPGGTRTGSSVRVDAAWLTGPVPSMPGYGVYMQNGPYAVDGAIPASGGIVNDVYGAIYRDYVTAFAYGYWGGRFGNDTADFTRPPRTSAFAAARSNADPFPAWSAYAQAITSISTAYAMPFGDTFVPDSVNPLVPGIHDVTMMRVTLMSDSGTPPVVAPTPSPTVTASPSPTPTATATLPGSPRSAYAPIDATAADTLHGATATTGHVGPLGNGDWLKFDGIDFGPAGLFQAYAVVAGGSAGSGLVTYRVDSPTGPTLGSFAVGSTGGWDSYRQIPANAGGATGIHDLYVTFASGFPGDYVNLARLQFGKAGTPTPDLTTP